MPFHHLTEHQLQRCHYLHLLQVPDTRKVESFGRSLMTSGAALNARTLIDFSQQVCRWGGKTGARVFWRIKGNPTTTIVASFTNAIKELSLPPPNLLSAKNALAPISGLGIFSYSSKHLRMLAPEICPVLDRVIDQHLVNSSVRYAKSTIVQRFLGYADFCQARARQLTSLNITLGDFLVPASLGTLATTTIPAQCHWTAADIDMACFAWLQGWYASGGPAAKNRAQIRTMQRQCTACPNTGRKRELVAPNKTNKTTIFLAQNHERDTAITIKETCGKRTNNAWICRSHGSLDFKKNNAKGTTRYLIGEILDQGVDVTQDPDWEPSHAAKTCHHGGTNYQGHLLKGTVEDAVRYLKQFFDVKACPDNVTETQDWIDAL
jgi:hypothetical protein